MGRRLGIVAQSPAQRSSQRGAAAVVEDDSVTILQLNVEGHTNAKLTHTVTSPYTHCILIHEARSLVFMIIITEQFSILHKFVNDI